MVLGRSWLLVGVWADNEKIFKGFLLGRPLAEHIMFSLTDRSRYLKDVQKSR